MRSGGSTTASYNAFKTTSYSLTKWQGYMSLKEDVSFFLLAIGRQMQWGFIPKTTQNHPTITLPIALRKKYFFAAGKYIDYASSSGNEYGYIYNKTLTNFKIVFESGSDMTWLVIGMQQWEMVTTSGSGIGSSRFTYPISLSVCYTAVASSVATTTGASDGSGFVNTLGNSSCNVVHERTSGFTIIVIGRQMQWGYTTSYNNVTVNFPVAYSTQIFCLTAFHSAPGVSTLDVYARHVMLNGFTFVVAAPDSAYTSFERAYWLSIGVQTQWGYKASFNNSWTYFPIAFTLTVYGILGQQTTPSVTSHSHFDDVDLTKFHYKVTQYGTYPRFENEASGWFLAYGEQQWGVDHGRADGKVIKYPIAFSQFVKVVALDGFNSKRINCYSSLYDEPSLSYFKFNYDSESIFVNWIALGVQLPITITFASPLQPLNCNDVLFLDINVTVYSVLLFAASSLAKTAAYTLRIVIG